jgi:hypothetical protein
MKLDVEPLVRSYDLMIKDWTPYRFWFETYSTEANHYMQSLPRDNPNVIKTTSTGWTLEVSRNYSYSAVIKSIIDSAPHGVRVKYVQD